MKYKKVLFMTGNSTKEVNAYLYALTSGCKGIFKNFKFFFNEEVSNYDFLVVFESLSSNIIVNIPKEHTIFIAGEATSIKSYNQKFIEQFGHIITCQEKIQHSSKFLCSPGHTWFSKKSYDELISLKDVKKTKLLSIVVSNKTSTKGHRDRLEFCLKLKEQLGGDVDLFGRGFNEFEDKWDVIAPYKYSIAIENSIEKHWITEKVGDCYTSHTFPFYMGAPNVNEYYDPKSYELIDIYDFEASLEKIKKIINDNSHYEKHLKYLIEAKNDYLNKYSMLPMICDFINNKLKTTQSENIKAFTIYPEKDNFFKKTKAYIAQILTRFSRA